MKRFALLTSFFVLIALSIGAKAEVPPPAENLTAVVSLDSLTAEGLAENANAQFYLAITEFKNNGETKLVRAPKYPYALSVSQENQTQPTELWSNKLKKGESATLLFQLVEQKLASSDRDDPLGVAKLVITNQNGHLRSKWLILGSNKEPAREVTKAGERDTFTLKRKQGEYKFVLGLTANYSNKA